MERCCSEANVPEDAVEQFKIAVDEACTNVIKHAYKGDDARPIDVAVIVDPDRCTVRIRDTGETFRPGDYKAPDIFESARLRRAGGFGIQIMRRLMDKVEYRTKGKCNEVCLTKFFSPATANGEGSR